MCEQDEAWSTSRYFSEARMRELYDEKGPGTSGTGPNRAALEEEARRMIASSLEPADRIEAVYDSKMIPGLWP